MTPHQLAFLVLGVVIVVSALMVVTVRDLVHAALFLVMCFAGVAGLYVLLQAEFLAVAQVLVYIGAITVLILFGIMLTRHIAGGALPHLASHWKAALGGAWAVLLILLYVAVSAEWRVSPQPPMDSTTTVGLAFVTRYVLPFELASVILLAALAGAVILARDERR